MLRLLTALVCLVAAAAIVPAAPIPKHLMRETPFAFPTSLGTRWVYEGDGNGEQTLVISDVKEKDGAKLVTTEEVSEDGTRTPRTVMRMTAEGVFVVSESGRNYDPPWCLFILPYREGQTWTSKSDFGVGCEFTRTMKTGPREKVRVPAGEFNAARIDSEVDIRCENNAKNWKMTCWYAHGVGLVKIDENVMKLKSFIPGK